MKKIYIIKKKSEIDNLFTQKVKRGNSYFTVFLKESKNNVNFKFAMSIGKKFGNAVARNKIKRQIRSIIRDNKEIINKSLDFVIVIKPKANTLSYKEISKQLTSLLISLNVMEKINEKL